MSFNLVEGSEPPYPLRWDRLAPDGVVQCLILDPEPHEGQLIKLVHVPNYGTFHRLVLEAISTFGWADDAVLRVDDVIIRLVTGTIRGERVAPLDQIEMHDDHLSISSDWTGSVALQGQFIEIVAPGDDEATAEINAMAISGLLALIFGPSAVGNVVFSEPYTVAPGEPQKGEYRVPIASNLPAAIEDQGLDAVDRVLPGLLEDDQLKRALRLALHWLQRGIRANNPLDELICYFVGIEAILNTFAAKHGPIPEVETRRKSLSKAFVKIPKGIFEADMIERLRNCGARATTRERFVFYTEQRGIDQSWSEQFDELAQTRNRVLHGEPTRVTAESSSRAQRLLIEMLKRELGIDLQLPCEVGPKVVALTVHWFFADYGFHGARLS